MALGDEDRELGRLFREARTIVVVGIKAGEQEDAYRVPLYMQTQGYRIIPVNPNYDEILGEKCYPAVQEIPEPIDVVDVFQRSEVRKPGCHRG